MTKKTGVPTQSHTSFPSLGNKALQKSYYDEVAKCTLSKQEARAKKKKEQDDYLALLRSIRADMPTMFIKDIMVKYHLTQYKWEKIKGDIYIHCRNN